jgi:hypothetical protein
MASEVSMEFEEASPDEEGLEERIAALEERNRELRVENERLQSITGPRVTYRQAAVLFLLVAAAAVGGTMLYPESRDVLIAVAGTGAFGAVLLGMLVQEWLLSASVGRALYDTLWQNERRIASRLGVAETSRYVPTGRESLGVRLYLSRSLDDPIPPPESLDSTVVSVEGHYTLLLEPTGRELFGIFERTNGDLPDDLRVAAIALGDATRLDHPIRSFIGVGLADLVGMPVESETWTDEDDNAVLAFRWEDEAPDDEVTDDGLADADADVFVPDE